MDYAKYSKQALEALAPGSQEMKLRIDEFKSGINAELHAAVHEKMREIVLSLNALGHSLAESPRSKAVHIDFTQTNDEQEHVFYLCCDTVISSGYRGTHGNIE